jgi:inner membrane protein
MTARTHDAIAFTSLFAVAVYVSPAELNLYTLFAAIIGNQIGSILPDIDQASNRLWDFLPAGDTLGKYLRKIFYKHRTLTHSLIGVFLVYIFFGWLLPKIFNSTVIDAQIVLGAIMIGVIAHIAADSLTEQGVPLLFPLKFRFGIPPISSWRIKTDGWFEKLIILPAIALFLVWFIDYKRDQIIVLFQKITTN